eukprot:1255528-Prymnesium_polylepis.1
MAGRHCLRPGVVSGHYCLRPGVVSGRGCLGLGRGDHRWGRGDPRWGRGGGAHGGRGRDELVHLGGALGEGRALRAGAVEGRICAPDVAAAARAHKSIGAPQT